MVKIQKIIQKSNNYINGCFTSIFTSWWLNQPIWKICSSKWVHLSPKRDENKTYLRCHHPGMFHIHLYLDSLRTSFLSLIDRAHRANWTVTRSRCHALETSYRRNEAFFSRGFGGQYNRSKKKRWQKSTERKQRFFQKKWEKIKRVKQKYINCKHVQILSSPSSMSAFPICLPSGKTWNEGPGENTIHHLPLCPADLGPKDAIMEFFREAMMVLLWLDLHSPNAWCFFLFK